jgi:hypothetical protein
MQWYNMVDVFSPNQEEFELNRKEQALTCTAHANVLGKNIHTIKKNRETLVDHRKELCLERNVEKN